MEKFKDEITDLIISQLAQLEAAAIDVQRRYQQDLNEASRVAGRFPLGFFPRLRKHGEGFYIYWEKYEVSEGSTRLQKGGKEFRRSQAVKQRKKGEAYPPHAFQGPPPPWELDVILTAERELSPLRTSAMNWMRVLKDVRRID